MTKKEDNEYIPIKSSLKTKISKEKGEKTYTQFITDLFIKSKKGSDDFQKSGLSREEYLRREGFCEALYRTRWMTLTNTEKEKTPERPDLVYEKEFKGWADFVDMQKDDWYNWTGQ